MKSNEALIKHVLLDYALIIPKRLEASSLELKEEDYQNLDAIKNTVLYKSNQGHSKHIIAKILIAAVIAVSLLVTLIACVESIRNFVFEIFDISIDVTGDSETQTIVKESIEEVYSCSLLSQNHEIIVEEYTSIGTMIAWVTGDNFTVLEQSIIDGTTVSLDKDEYSDYGWKKIDELSILYSNSSGYYNIVWEQYGYLFTLNCPESLGWDFVEEAITSLEIVDVPIESVE